MLSITIKGLQKIKMQGMGKLVAKSNARKIFCAGPYEISVLRATVYKLLNEDTDMICIEYIIQCDLHTNYFDRSNKYEIYLLLYEWPQITLSFQQTFIRRFIDVCQGISPLSSCNNIGEIHYSWNQIRFYRSFLNRYFYVFYSKSLLSWSSAMEICFSRNMTLPTFRDNTNLLQTALFLSTKYIQPQALYIGLLKRVGTFLYCVHQLLIQILNIPIFLQHYFHEFEIGPFFFRITTPG